MSAGIIRVFGERVAEVPLVATCTECQGQVNVMEAQLFLHFLFHF